MRVNESLGNNEFRLIFRTGVLVGCWHISTLRFTAAATQRQQVERDRTARLKLESETERAFHKQKIKKKIKQGERERAHP